MSGAIISTIKGQSLSYSTVSDYRLAGNLKIKSDETTPKLEDKIQKLQRGFNFYHSFSKLFFGSEAKQQWNEIFNHSAALSQYISKAKTVSEKIKDSKRDTSDLSKILELESLIKNTPQSLCVGDSPSFAAKALGYMIMVGGALFVLHALPSIIALMPAVMSLAFLQVGIELVGGLIMIGYACEFSISLAGQSAKYQLTQIRNEFSKVLSHMKKVEATTQLVTAFRAMAIEMEEATQSKKEEFVPRLLHLFKVLGVEEKQTISQLLTLSKAVDTENRQTLTQLLIGSKRINIPLPLHQKINEYDPDHFFTLVKETERAVFSELNEKNAQDTLDVYSMSIDKTVLVLG